MLAILLGLSFANGARCQNPTEEWIRYVDRGAGFSIDLPKGMTHDLAYPGAGTGSVPDGLRLVIAFKGARPFRISGLKFDSQSKRAAWPLKMASYDVFEQLEFDSGKAVHIEQLTQPGTELAYVEFDLLRRGWGWSLTAYCSRDDVARTRRYLKRIAESFRWDNDVEIQGPPPLTREEAIRLFEERASHEDRAAFEQAMASHAPDSATKALELVLFNLEAKELIKIGITQVEGLHWSVAWTDDSREVIDAVVEALRGTDVGAFGSSGHGSTGWYVLRERFFEARALLLASKELQEMDFRVPKIRLKIKDQADGTP